jgi:hypothetical protein
VGGDVMKAILLALLLLTGRVYAEDSTEVVVKNLQSKSYNDLLKRFIPRDVSIHYFKTNKDVGSSIILLEGGLGVSALEFDDEKRAGVLDVIAKFEEWKKKASQKGVKLEKEIGSVITKQAWHKMGEHYTSQDAVPVTFSFFTRTVGKYELVIETPTIRDAFNEYDTEKIDDYYFEADQVKALKAGLTQANIDSALKKEAAKKKVADEFK